MTQTFEICQYDVPTSPPEPEGCREDSVFVRVSQNTTKKL